MLYHPKELLWIARWLVNNGAGRYAAFRELLEAETRGRALPRPSGADVSTKRSP